MRRSFALSCAARWLWAASILAVACPTAVFAQWKDQTFLLQPGWNAIYMNVEAGHTTLDALVGADSSNPIQAIWLWQPNPSTAQFVVSPAIPTTTGSQWLSWDRATGATSELQRLRANAAYLIQVQAGAAPFAWTVRGKVAPPSYSWTSSGLNFVGFQVADAGPPISFETFFEPAPELLSAEIFYYPGGNLGPSNPAPVFARRTQAVRRGDAYWVRSNGSFNSYFGPFELVIDEDSGLNFGDQLSQIRLRLRNLTPSPLTVTLTSQASAEPPSGQPALIHHTPPGGVSQPQPPPLLLRGALNPVDLTYAYTSLEAGPQSIALDAKGQPGAEKTLVIGLNRSQMAGQPGNVYGGVLRLTDSLNLSAVDIPATATVPSLAGLWVGNASITSVDHYLRTYATQPDGTLTTTPIAGGTTGSYVPLQTNTSPGAVARPFPLRLIVHHDGTQSVLLQRVFQGLDSTTNRILTRQEQFLSPVQLSSARRISCTHLPWSASNPGWPINGVFGGSAGSLTVTVPIAHTDQASNPFVHTYHPDHDGLDPAGVNALTPGMESYGISRTITLSFTAPGNSFTDLTQGSGTMRGVYSESLAVNGAAGQTRVFRCTGSFSLNRVSDIAALTP